MGRFEEIADGTRARDYGVSFTSLDAREWTCDLGLLTADDDLLILERAADVARSKKAKPERGDPVFEFAMSCEIVAFTAIDPESPKDAPARFFKSSEQVRKNLDRDRVHYLQARQAAFQEKQSPLKRSHTEEEYRRKIVELAVEGAANANPFDDWAPSSVVDLMCFTARLCVALMTFKSTSIGSSSTELSTTTPATNSSSTDSPPASEQ